MKMKFLQIFVVVAIIGLTSSYESEQPSKEEIVEPDEHDVGEALEKRSTVEEYMQWHINNMKGKGRQFSTRTYSYFTIAGDYKRAASDFKYIIPKTLWSRIYKFSSGFRMRLLNYYIEVKQGGNKLMRAKAILSIMSRKGGIVNAYFFLYK